MNICLVLWSDVHHAFHIFTFVVVTYCSLIEHILHGQAL